MGHDMPHMLAQLAGQGHDYKSQLGWGTPLRDHLNPDYPINGFEKENAHSHYLDLQEAIASQQFDTFIFTEMVEIKDAIKYFDSAKYTKQLITSMRKLSPTSTIYLYESWHEVTDPEGWITRLDRDLDKYWLKEILDKAMAPLSDQPPVYVIPVGQVFSSFFKEVEKRGGVKGIQSPEDIFAKTDDGQLDPIHINDIGVYFVALVHYAVLYQESPVGKPYQLTKFSGQPATAPSNEAAQLMQEVTWQVVSTFTRAGLE